MGDGDGHQFSFPALCSGPCEWRGVQAHIGFAFSPMHSGLGSRSPSPACATWWSGHHGAPVGGPGTGQSPGRVRGGVPDHEMWGRRGGDWAGLWGAA